MVLAAYNLNCPMKDYNHQEQIITIILGQDPKNMTIFFFLTKSPVFETLLFSQNNDS